MLSCLAPEPGKGRGSVCLGECSGDGSSSGIFGGTGKICGTRTDARPDVSDEAGAGDVFAILGSTGGKNISGFSVP